MVNANDLLTKIRADVEAKVFKPIELAREAGLQPSTLYTMLEPGWSNRAVENLEAVAAAYQRLTNQNSSPGCEAAPAN